MAIWQRVSRRRSALSRLTREVGSELRKVVWPTREHATKLTALVCGVSAVVGAILGGLDVTLSEFFQTLLGRA